MDTDKAIYMIQALANGVNPVTGEVLPAGSTYEHPEVIRALFFSIKALEQYKKRQTRINKLPVNAGKPWTDGEDNKLLTEFDSGVALGEMAKNHSRTKGAIAARLVRLGRIKERAEILGTT